MTATSLFKHLSIVLMVALLGTGCASTRGSSSGLSADQQQMREQAKAYNKTVAQGAGWGALAGGILMAALGGDAKSIAAGAAVGAAVGGVAGSYYAEKQKEYASNEKMLEAMIADAAQYNQEAMQLIETAERVYEREVHMLASLKRQREAGEISRRQLKKKLRVARADKELLEESLASTRSELEKYQEAFAQYQESHPDEDLVDFETEIAEIAQRVDELESLTQRMTTAIDEAAS